MLNGKELILLLSEDRAALAKYRIEKARDCIAASEVLLKDNLFADSANRSYYAIFNSINALFALSGKAYKKHSGVLTYFGLDYIQKGLIEPEYGHIASNSFRIRTKSDYSDFYIVSKQEVIEQHENAVKFVDRIERFISEEINKSSD